MADVVGLEKNNAHMTNMVEKKSSWEKLIFWVEVGKDVEVLLVNCFQSPTLIHDKIVSLVHQIIDFIPDFICCCTNLTCGSVKWAYENLSRLNKFLVLVLLSPVNASMHVVIHTSLQSLSLVSLAKATCIVKLCNKLSSKLLDEMMKKAENILCFSAEPSPGTSQMKTFRDTKESFISFWWLNCNAAMIMRAVFSVEKHWGCLLLMPLN